MFEKEVDILAHASATCQVVHRATSRNTILIEQVLALLSARHVLSFTERPYDAEDGGASIVWPNEVAWINKHVVGQEVRFGFNPLPCRINRGRDTEIISQSISENTVIDWENSIAVHLKQSLTISKAMLTYKNGASFSLPF